MLIAYEMCQDSGIFDNRESQLYTYKKINNTIVFNNKF